MAVIELLWHLNISDTSKYLIILAIFVSIMLLCIFAGKKKNKKNKSKSKCQKKYNKCMKNNLINNTNNFCYPCMNNGQPIDFVYDTESNQLHTPI